MKPLNFSLTLEARVIFLGVREFSKDPPFQVPKIDVLNLISYKAILGLGFPSHKIHKPYMQLILMTTSILITLPKTNVAPKNVGFQ